jgi:hypothetical protein
LGIFIAFTVPNTKIPVTKRRGAEVRRILAIIVFFSLVSTAQAAYLDLAWDPNLEPDLGGYRIYYGTESGNYINFIDVGNVTYYALGSLLDGIRYYIAITAYDTAGNESSFSGEVSGTSSPGEPDPVSTNTGTVGSSSAGGCFVSTVLDNS